jgi:LPPG:FO 2-phospho-L-lactate transferase
LSGFRDLLKEKPVIAVSPIINGKALKGPAAKMFMELGIQPSFTAVAEHYQDFLNGYIFDNAERYAERQPFDGWGIMTLQTHTVMQTADEKIALAKEVLSLLERIRANGR